ncbi:hypothetical protein RchiOBHm_Chr7g0203191 [Rosa chinensis]|uniref:Uncharacterized protein n=1 Tax=Rosa chinensis TaxID=74649 RepID=A0A2P6P8D2_ROSCH|nr:hypothetical protein RchiOBHm_Chr7g0203191 [Rosa chinensis]
MVLHMAVVASVKLKLLSCTSHSLITPVVSGLIWPFVIKVSFSLRSVRRAYADVIHFSRLFFFQLNQIVRAFDEHDVRADHDEPAAIVGNNNNNTRLERALRLVCRTVTNGFRRSSEALQLDEQSIHALAMIAL